MTLHHEVPGMTEPLPALFHYSAEPLGELRAVAQEVEPRLGILAKPRGLWLSAEDDWAQWCTENEFAVDKLAVRARVTLKEPDRLLRLQTVQEILDFQAKYVRLVKGFELFVGIDWTRAAAEYAGILIAPYQRSARHDLMWYYTWDCASACIWDTSIIERVEPA
jgi:hypothetical protein